MSSTDDPRPPAAQLLDRKVVALNPAGGTAALTFEAISAFTNRHGTVQGGFISAMLDSAASNALLPTLPADTTAVTTRLDTRFLSPARVGMLSAAAKVVEVDEKTALVEASLSDLAGTVLATASVEFRLLRKKRFSDA